MLAGASSTGAGQTLGAEESGAGNSITLHNTSAVTIRQDNKMLQ